MDSFHLISLGCAKNFVDSEVMIGALIEKGWTIVDDPYGVDVVIINTCGFIQSAVEEAIEEILEIIRVKDDCPDVKIVVVGCLVQRYKEKLAEEFPEVDLFVGTEGPHLLPGYLQNFRGDESSTLETRTILPPAFLMDHRTPRVLATPYFRSWLKITEGCDNRCSYCKIPFIRGRLRSRISEDLVAEAVRLEQRGVKELSLIAQDSTAYGNDLKKGDYSIVRLLEELLQNTTIPWLRLLYLYPSGVSDELIRLLAGERRITPYLDIPFQHVNDRILKMMNRPYGYDLLEELVEKLRTAVPDVALRTTFLVGFPGETEAEFLQIEKFMKSLKLDHVGVFDYANEEGIPAAKLPGHLPDDEKIRRRDYLLELQTTISREKCHKYIGTVQDVLVEGVSVETDLLLEGRTKYQAPEVDGCVYINAGNATAGDIVQVEIEEAATYDLVGGIVGVQADKEN